MRYFIDTEFHEDGRIIDLISIAMVREDGQEFYAESSEFDPELCNSWVKEHVLPKLGPPNRRIPRGDIRKAIEIIIAADGEPPIFWGYYSDYDWVLFCQLWGKMIDLPKGWPKVCYDLKQELVRYEIKEEDLPVQDPATEHQALEDARWVRHAWLAVAPPHLLPPDSDADSHDEERVIEASFTVEIAGVGLTHAADASTGHAVRLDGLPLHPRWSTVLIPLLPDQVKQLSRGLYHMAKLTVLIEPLQHLAGE